MRVNFSVTNQLATPSIHAAALANRPPAGQPGRLFVDTDNPSSGIYRDTGTVWENITGGAGAGNLQTVTDAGNTTDNNILLTYPDNTLANALVFYNDQLAQEEYLIEKRGTGITTNDSLAIQSRGNISPSTNPVGFLIDGANDVIKSFYTTSYTERGLKLDFVNENYILGDLTNNFIKLEVSSGDAYLQSTNSWSLVADTNCILTAQPQEIKSRFLGNDIGLKLDFANDLYHFGGYSGGGTPLEYGLKVDGPNQNIFLGDYSGQLGPGSYLQFDHIGNVIKTGVFGFGDVGLKLDFANYSYYFGDFAVSNSGTYFLIDDNNQIIESYCVNVGPGGNGGLQLDFGTNKYSLGDYNNGVTGTSIIVDDSIQLIKTENNGNDIGLKLDFNNAEYFLGNFNAAGNYVWIDNANGVTLGDAIGYVNNTSLRVNDATQIIQTSNLSNYIGLKLDFATNSYSLGDYNSGVTGTSIIVDDANQFIKTSWQAADIGLKLDFVSSVYYLGDFNNIQDLIYCKADIGNGFFDIVSAQYVNFRAEGANVQIGDIDNFDNGTRFGVDDLNQKLTATTNLLVGSSGSSSGQHLKIKVGTTDYVIELKNP